MCFLAAFLREISAELLKTLGPPGMSVPGPAQGSGQSSCCCFSAQKDSAGAWASLFWPCLFWFLLMHGQNCSPGSGKSEQRCCCLATALGRRCCPQDWDPVSAQRVKFLLPYPCHHLFALLKATGTSTNLLTAESHGHIFSQCQIQCWCHVPGTDLSARTGSRWKHWSLLALTGFNGFTQLLTQTSLTPQWKQIFNKQIFFCCSEILLKIERKAVGAQQNHCESCLIHVASVWLGKILCHPCNL